MGTCKLILDNKRDVYYLRQPALSLNAAILNGS